MDEGEDKRSTAIDRKSKAARDGRQEIWRGRAALVSIAVLTCVVVVALGRGGRGGSIEVVETGFTELSDEFADVSFGVVMENTSDEVAYHTTACVAVRVTGEEASGCQEFTVEMLQPGQRIGLGAAIKVFPSDADAKVTGIDVEIEGPAAWEDPQDWADTDPRGDYDDPDLPYEIVAHDLSVTSPRPRASP